MGSLGASPFLSPPLDSFLSSPHCGCASLSELAAAGRTPAVTARASKLATKLLERFVMVGQALGWARVLSNARQAPLLSYPDVGRHWPASVQYWPSSHSVSDSQYSGGTQRSPLPSWRHSLPCSQSESLAQGQGSGVSMVRKQALIQTVLSAMSSTARPVRIRSCIAAALELVARSRRGRA